MTILNKTKKVFNRIANLFNYKLKVLRSAGSMIIFKRNTKDKNYNQITTYANYTPFNSDKTFNKIYNQIKDYTLVDKLRCYELYELVKETNHLQGDILEVGTWRGGSGCLISKTSTQGNTYLCDTFEGVVKCSNRDDVYMGGEHSDTSEEIVKKLIKSLKLKNTSILKGIFPEDTSKFIKDKTFRFCHIDVDVYNSAKDTVNWIWNKLEVGGIIVFDDYGFKGLKGITDFVNEQKEKKDRIVIYNLNGHGIIIKTPKTANNRTKNKNI